MVTNHASINAVKFSTNARTNALATMTANPVVTTVATIPAHVFTPKKDW